MPLHPAHRPPSQTLQEDREAIILADQLGFHDAFVGEHLTDQAEVIERYTTATTKEARNASEGTEVVIGAMICG